MANFVFNIAKGRVTELYNRVKSNDPTNAALIIVLIESASIETDAAMKDRDDLAAVLGATTNEQTNQSRKVLTDSDLAALPAPDDSNDRYDLDLPDQTWTSLGGNAIAKLLVCYDSDTTGGSDTNIIPLTAHDFAITPDGSDVTAQINVFYRAGE
jgi:hypothetical protein